jgi:hypothetical protein
LIRDRNTFPVIVSGMVAGDPYQGGAAWAVLQYVVGLRRLGYDVYLFEPVRAENLRPAGSPLQDSENASYFVDVMRTFGLNASLLLEGTCETAGLPYDKVRGIAKRAGTLLNISGMLARPDLVSEIPVRVYLDLDPAFNQLWHDAEGIDMRFSAHNRFVTVGQALGSPACTVPTCGIDWTTTFPPVVLEHWPPDNGVAHDAFTTIANWRGYGSIQHGGVFYGQKAHSLRRFMDLPARTTQKITMALNIHHGETKDLEALVNNNWNLVDPGAVAGTPCEYRGFVRGSKAELGIAKSGYAASRCGWFSDRSACYLASGRPVIAQETGFSEYLPCGEGLFRFDNAVEALSGIEAINGDYERHSRAAREIAREYFDSDKVLSRLMQ